MFQAGDGLVCPHHQDVQLPETGAAESGGTGADHGSDTESRIPRTSRARENWVSHLSVSNGQDHAMNCNVGVLLVL